MSKTPKSVWGIDRNDVAGCVAYYNQHGVSDEESRTMIKLQDDPAKLLMIMRGWKVRKTSP